MDGLKYRSANEWNEIQEEIAKHARVEEHLPFQHHRVHKQRPRSASKLPIKFLRWEIHQAIFGLHWKFKLLQARNFLKIIIKYTM